MAVWAGIYVRCEQCDSKQIRLTTCPNREVADKPLIDLGDGRHYAQVWYQCFECGNREAVQFTEEEDGTVSVV